MIIFHLFRTQLLFSFGVQSALKVLVNAFEVTGGLESAEWQALYELASTNITPFLASTNTEVQERACLLHSVLDLISTSSNGAESVASIISELLAIFAVELLPVAPKAQKKVKCNLDLAERMHDEPPRIQLKQLVEGTTQPAKNNRAWESEEEVETRSQSEQSEADRDSRDRRSSERKERELERDRSGSNRQNTHSQFYLGKDTSAPVSVTTLCK
jgi:type IV secretory pathway VirB10-like protein